MNNLKTELYTFWMTCMACELYLGKAVVFKEKRKIRNEGKHTKKNLYSFFKAPVTNYHKLGA